MKRSRRLLALAPASLLVIGILAAPASAAVPRCFGQRATIVGTAGDDRLRGTQGRDVIVGRGGNDVIRGLGGNDLLCGGGGGDLVVGGDGRDRLHGGGAPDGLQPGAGNDVIVGGGTRFDDVRYPDASGPITGSLVTGRVTGMGRDILESGIEQIVGGPFDDVIEGNDVFNVLIGLAGNDTITALGGDDALVGGAGDDVLDGGDGSDFAENYFVDAFMSQDLLAGPVTVNLVTGVSTGNGNDTLIAIESASGSMGDDVMTGNAEDNEFVALFEGDDTVDAGPGDDTVDGGEGVDDLDGGPGLDLLGNLDAPEGMTVNLSTQTNSHGDVFTGFENVWGTFFDDVITGDDGPNELVGFDGVDLLSGLGGDDLILGGFFGFVDPEADTADGGLGTDACDAETEIACEADPPEDLSTASVRRPLSARTPTSIAIGMRSK
jgi:Ca2+-binding RTX toxin-like protein